MNDNKKIIVVSSIFLISVITLLIIYGGLIDKLYITDNEYVDDKLYIVVTAQWTTLLSESHNISYYIPAPTNNSDIYYIGKVFSRDKPDELTHFFEYYVDTTENCGCRV